MNKPIVLDIATFNRVLSECGGDLAYMKAGIEQEGDDFLRGKEIQAEQFKSSDEFGVDDDEDGEDSYDEHCRRESMAWRFV